MHLYMFSRGIFGEVEKWKNFAQYAFWKWRRQNLKTGEWEESLVQGALRPSVFGVWEYVFPEECLAEVLSYFGLQENEWVNRDIRTMFLRKIFNCKKIPKKIFEEAKKIKFPLMFKDRSICVSTPKVIYGAGLELIGIKEDKWLELNGYWQEGL